MCGKCKQTTTERDATGRCREAPPQRLSGGAGWALFLDLDGTLCPFREDPQAVQLTAVQQGMLARLAQRLDGAMCVVSGRSNDDLDRALGQLDVDRCGEHGHQRDAQVTAVTREELREAEQAVRAVAGLFEGDGIWVESKATSCAVHYRCAPRFADCLLKMMRAVAEFYPQLRLLEGQSVIELASRHMNKGQALRRYMQRAPYRGRCPVAVGDDRTDEDAFLAATSLGGFAVSVGVRYSPSARYWLPDAFAVNDWLEQLSALHPAAGHA
jgi:trehalose 6-phosphate phosphatase